MQGKKIHGILSITEWVVFWETMEFCTHLFTLYFYFQVIKDHFVWSYTA